MMRLNYGTAQGDRSAENQGQTAVCEVRLVPQGQGDGDGDDAGFLMKVRKEDPAVTRTIIRKAFCVRCTF